MPRWFTGLLPRFAKRPWDIRAGADLDRILRRIVDGMNRLQGQPRDPEFVQAVGNVGTGPAPALDDHVHPMGIVEEKGDLLGHDGTVAVRIPGGSDGQVLTSDSSTASGLGWADATGGALAMVKNFYGN